MRGWGVGRKREREGERERDRQTDRQTERKSETEWSLPVYLQKERLGEGGKRQKEGGKRETESCGVGGLEIQSQTP